MSIRTLALALAAAFIAGNVFAADTSTLANLQGKWSTKRTSSSGQEVTQVIEIKGDQLVFQMKGADNEVRLHAKGVVKAEALGPLKVIKISGIEGGRSASELAPVDDEFINPYVLSGDTLFVASNFDRERERRQPSVDAYKREGAAEATPTGKLAGKWKMLLKMGEDERDYEMNIVESSGQLSGTLISPRSGEHKFKSVTFTAGKLAMELPREIEGNSLTFVYTGTLKDGQLSGEFAVKDYEDQFKGTWKATK